MKRKRWVLVLIIANILLFIGSMLCLIGTSKNNAIIGSIGEFTYEEAGNGEEILILADNKRITMQFGQTSVKVVESYTAKSREESLAIALFVRERASATGYTVSRKITEIYGEYRLHNILYGLGIKREHTSDSDLDYEKDRRWYVNAMSKFIGWSGI